jgi:2-isopropylmalate synthase
VLGNVPDYFDVEGFSVTVERRHNALGKLVSVSQAVVKTVIGGERVLTVAEGKPQ